MFVAIQLSKEKKKKGKENKILPTRDANDDGEKTHHVPIFIFFLSMNKTERGPPENLPKVETVVVYYPIILKANPAKSLLFNYKVLSFRSNCSKICEI